MKMLSIRQPWVWAILYAGKDVENRTWLTRYRGPLALHASQRYDRDGHVWIESEFGLLIPDSLPSGGLCGVVELLDCVTEYPSRWCHGPYGWVFGSPTPIPFLALRGRLGLFEVPQHGVPGWGGASSGLLLGDMPCR